MAWPPSAPTADELYAIARSSLPRFLFQKPGYREVLWAAARTFERVGRYIDERYQQTFIARSTGIWTDQHLRDRGSWRQSSEADEEAAERARTIAEAGTPDTLTGIADASLEAAGVVGTSALVELGPDGARFLVDSTTTRRVAFLGRGYRMASRQPRRSIVVLPYPTSAATQAAIAEACRKRRAGGYPVSFERRRVP